MKTERLNIRLTAQEQELLRRAAETSGQTISDYVLSRVLADAHDDLADRGLFEVDAPRWKELGSRLDRPPTYRPELGKLLDRPRPWEDGETVVADERPERVAAAPEASSKAPYLLREQAIRVLGGGAPSIRRVFVLQFRSQKGEIVSEVEYSFAPGDAPDLRVRTNDGKLTVFFDEDVDHDAVAPVEATDR